MSVSAYALTSVDEVFAYIGSDAQRDAFWVYFSGTSGTNTIQINDNSVVLVDADNGTTTIDITNASYDTLTELVAAINAVAGWNAGLIYHGSATSTDLITTGALDAEGQAKEQTIKIKDVYLIERLIDRATDAIERYLNRKIKTRDYSREPYFGRSGDKLLLDQYPVTRAIRLSRGRENAFSILNTSTDATYCTVEVTSSVIRLIVKDGTNDDDTSLTLSGYTSIDALITAIEALGKGWDCTALATDTSTRDADELLPRPSMNVTTTKSAYVETPDEDLADYKLLKYGDEDRNEGMIYYSPGFSPNTEYFIDYTAGFTTIPESLAHACIKLAAKRYAESKTDPTMRSETMGDYKYERFSLLDLDKVFEGMPGLKTEIDVFKKRII